MIFDALSNAAYRVPLHDTGVELQGGVQSNTRPGAFGAEHLPAVRDQPNVPVPAGVDIQ